MQLLGPALDHLDLRHRLVQRQRADHARRKQPAPEDRLAVEMDDELHAVLQVVGQIADVPHPGPHQIVHGGPVAVGDVQERLHHLELEGDGHQVPLRLVPELVVLVDGRLDLGQRLRHHSPIARSAMASSHLPLPGRLPVCCAEREMVDSGLVCLPLSPDPRSGRCWRFGAGRQAAKEGCSPPVAAAVDEMAEEGKRESVVLSRGSYVNTEKEREKDKRATPSVDFIID
ncbi:hypothetical protein ZWY2020_001141 [Hordeum vulgare]|nr:hypothetical protein ZWY2020_001141 [Hordeum vulgare]